MPKFIFFSIFLAEMLALFCAVRRRRSSRAAQEEFRRRRR